MPALEFAQMSAIRGLKENTGVTDTEADRRVLDNQGLSAVQIEVICGELTNHSDPRGQVLTLL